MKTTAKTPLILAAVILIFVLVAGTCVSGNQENMSTNNSQVTDNSSIFSFIMESFESIVYTDEDKNITKWIDILENESETQENRINAAEMLGETGSNRAAKPLERIFLNEEESESLRHVATYSLGKVGDERITDSLIAELYRTDDSRAAIVALGEIGDKKSSHSH